MALGQVGHLAEARLRWKLQAKRKQSYEVIVT